MAIFGFDMFCSEHQGINMALHGECIVAYIESARHSFQDILYDAWHWLSLHMHKLCFYCVSPCCGCKGIVSCVACTGWLVLQ